MSNVTYSRAHHPADDYDDEEVEVEYAQDYDTAAQEPYDFEGEDEEYEGEQEPDSRMLTTPGRAVALGVAGVLLLVVFSAVVWILSTRTGPPPSQTGVNGLGVPVIAGMDAASGENQAPAKGAFAPDFVWNEGNHSVKLSSYRGNKPVFVNFCGTWCPPCRAEMPEMESFYAAHKDEIEVLGVSMYPRDNPPGVLDFVKAAPYSWKFIHDGDYKVAERYQVISVPSSYFIDKNGVIQVVHVGAMTGAMMENYLQQVRVSTPATPQAR
jgi:peroxiredoxin